MTFPFDYDGLLICPMTDEMKELDDCEMCNEKEACSSFIEAEKEEKKFNEEKKCKH